MLKVKVITVGKCKEHWLKAAISEYEKRLSLHLSFTWMEMRELKIAESESYIALDPKGELLNSPGLSKKLMRYFELGGSKLTFVIGGPEGIPINFLNKAAWLWSLSPLTFTHQLTRLIFIEQLYRSLEIEKGSSYHK